MNNTTNMSRNECKFNHLLLLLYDYIITSESMFFIIITYLTLYKHILKYLHFIYNYNKKPHKETFKIKLYECVDFI